MKYAVDFTKEAVKDTKKLTPKEKEKLHNLLINFLMVDPFKGKKLLGDLHGLYSWRLTYKDRIIYEIDDTNKRIVIHKTKTHYGD